MARRIGMLIRAGVLVVLAAVPLIYSGRFHNSFGVPKQAFFQAAVAVLLLLFGGKKIPELMRGLGRGMREFKDAQKGDPSDPDNDGK